MESDKDKQQGKRKEQTEFSHDVGYYGFIGFVLTILILLIIL